MINSFAVILFCLLHFSWGYFLIDSDTSGEDHFAARRRDQKLLSLVVSDEFESDNRRFDKANDRLFEAVEKPDNTNEAIQFCKCYPSIFREYC
jgi:hypothetical protein